MFAVVKTGSKQYKVQKNDILKIEKIDGEPGTEVKLDQILMVGEGAKNIIIGTPMVIGATITAEILSQSRDKKIIIFKKQRRQHYRRKNGHRQSITHLVIKDIKIA
jgi:large subunit ribosomal protein L21